MKKMNHQKLQMVSNIFGSIFKKSKTLFVANVEMSIHIFRMFWRELTQSFGELCTLMFLFPFRYNSLFLHNNEEIFAFAKYHLF